MGLLVKVIQQFGLLRAKCQCVEKGTSTKFKEIVALEGGGDFLPRQDPSDRYKECRICEALEGSEE